MEIEAPFADDDMTGQMTRNHDDAIRIEMRLQLLAWIGIVSSDPGRRGEAGA